MQNPLPASVGTSKEQLDTPSLLLDVAALRRNIKDVLRRNVKDAAVSARAGAWVHKTPSIANLQLECGAKGITVRGIREAIVFADHGFTDIRILRPLVTDWAKQQAEELAKACRIVTEDDGLPIIGDEIFEGCVTISARIASTPTPDRAIHDCGQKAIGRDFGDPTIKGHPDLRAIAGSAEHGMVLKRDDEQPFAIGDWLEFIPADFATAFTLHDVVFALEDDKLLDTWPIKARGAF